MLIVSSKLHYLLVVGLEAPFDSNPLLMQSEHYLLNVLLGILKEGWEFLQALAVNGKEHELIGAVILEIVRIYSPLTNYLL